MSEASKRLNKELNIDENKYIYSPIEEVVDRLLNQKEQTLFRKHFIENASLKEISHQGKISYQKTEETYKTIIKKINSYYSLLDSSGRHVFFSTMDLSPETIQKLEKASLKTTPSLIKYIKKNPANWGSDLKIPFTDKKKILDGFAPYLERGNVTKEKQLYEAMEITPPPHTLNISSLLYHHCSIIAFDILCDKLLGNLTVKDLSEKYNTYPSYISETTTDATNLINTYYQGFDRAGRPISIMAILSLSPKSKSVLVKNNLENLNMLIQIITKNPMDWNKKYEISNYIKKDIEYCLVNAGLITSSACLKNHKGIPLKTLLTTDLRTFDDRIIDDFRLDREKTNAVSLDTAMKNLLSDRTIEILKMKYMDQMMFTEISDYFNLSENASRPIVISAKRKICNYYNSIDKNGKSSLSTFEELFCKTYGINEAKRKNFPIHESLSRTLSHDEIDILKLKLMSSYDPSFISHLYGCSENTMISILKSIDDKINNFFSKIDENGVPLNVEVLDITTSMIENLRTVKLDNIQALKDVIFLRPINWYKSYGLSRVAKIHIEDALKEKGITIGDDKGEADLICRFFYVSSQQNAKLPLITVMKKVLTDIEHELILKYLGGKSIEQLAVAYKYSFGKVERMIREIKNKVFNYYDNLDNNNNPIDLISLPLPSTMLQKMNNSITTVNELKALVESDNAHWHEQFNFNLREKKKVENTLSNCGVFGKDQTPFDMIANAFQIEKEKTDIVPISFVLYTVVSERDVEIIKDRVYKDLKLKQIAKAHGLTTERVRQICERVRKKVNEYYDKYLVSGEVPCLFALGLTKDCISKLNKLGIKTVSDLISTIRQNLDSWNDCDIINDKLKRKIEKTLIKRGYTLTAENTVWNARVSMLNLKDAYMKALKRNNINTVQQLKTIIEGSPKYWNAGYNINKTAKQQIEKSMVDYNIELTGVDTEEMKETLSCSTGKVLSLLSSGVYSPYAKRPIYELDVEAQLTSSLLNQDILTTEELLILIFQNRGNWHQSLYKISYEDKKEIENALAKINIDINTLDPRCFRPISHMFDISMNRYRNAMLRNGIKTIYQLIYIINSNPTEWNKSLSYCGPAIKEEVEKALLEYYQATSISPLEDKLSFSIKNITDINFIDKVENRINNLVIDKNIKYSLINNNFVTIEDVLLLLYNNRNNWHRLLELNLSDERKLSLEQSLKRAGININCIDYHYFKPIEALTLCGLSSEKCDELRSKGFNTIFKLVKNISLNNFNDEEVNAVLVTYFSNS